MYIEKEPGLKNQENQGNQMGITKTVLGVLAIGVCAGGTLAQDLIPSDDRWATIGDPGNRNPEGSEVLWPNATPRGSVSYEYRMAKRELTLGEYLEFAIAYAPIYFQNHPEDFIADIAFSGVYLLIDTGQVRLRGSNYDRAAHMGWEYLARYINWLHHGKVIEEWAFETGVYDLSTFIWDENEEWMPQPVHTIEARYWVPTQSEWNKAAYWDPNKFGSGDGGYWLYPNRTDTPLLPCLIPSEGGQRNAGEDRSVFPLSVASYVDQKSPWGLYDLAGGESEWTEKLIPGLPGFHIRGRMGTEWRDTFYNVPFSEWEWDLDRLGTPFSTGVTGVLGARVASTQWSAADINMDGRVDYFDISLFIAKFLAEDLRADFRLDGELNRSDVEVFLGLYIHER